MHHFMALLFFDSSLALLRSVRGRTIKIPLAIYISCPRMGQAVFATRRWLLDATTCRCPQQGDSR